MRSIVFAWLIAVPAFATGLDGLKLERLLGLGHTLTAAPAVASALPWRLLGTLRSRDGASMAAVEWSSKSVTLQVGDVRDGVEVISIEQQTLTVRRRGRLEIVGAKPGIASSPATRSISRQVITQVLANPEPLLRQVQLMPVMVGGQWSGFRARFVKEGSLVASLGLRTGDVITRVNGETLDSPERLLSLLPLLRSAGRFEVELERDGQRVVEAVQLER